MSVSREDIVREARKLVGLKMRNRFELLTTIAKNLGIVDRATLARHDKGDNSVFAELRRCVVARRFGVEIPLSKIQAGDFGVALLTMENSFTDLDISFQLQGDRAMIVSALDPRAYIYIDDRCVVVEEVRDFKLSKAFRLRKRVEFSLNDEISIINEHAAMGQRLLTELKMARDVGKLFRFNIF